MSLLTNIVAYYKLDGNSNDSVGSNNGTSVSVTYSLGNGKINQGGGFLTTLPSSIGLPSGTKQSGSFTYSFWMNPTTLTPPFSQAYIHSDWSGAGRNFLILQNNQNFLINNGNGISSSDTVSTGNIITLGWQHIVFTRNVNVISLYRNGILATSYTSAYSGGATSNLTKIGADGLATAGYGFGGAIDEFGIWSRALNATEVTSLYNGGLGLSYPFSNSNFFQLF